MKWKLDDKKFTYVLRYYLPCLPQYEKEVTKKRTDELISFCKENLVDAVMFYVDLNPYWYYAPDSLEHTEYLVDIIKDVGEKLKAENISFQLNYQDLFGAWDGNCDNSHNCDWEFYTDEFGEKSYGSGCMIGEKFRKLAGKKLSLWAETKPDVIWIDDDMRIHNHRTEIHKVWAGEKSSEQMDYGCFCENHIALFNKKYNSSYDREALRNDILNSKEVFKKWREFNNDVYTDTSLWIEKTIKEKSPDTRVAIMTSLPDVHAVEGRNWNTFLNSLTGDDIPLLRPTFGPYCEGNPRDFYTSYALFNQLKANVEFQYKNEVNYLPEIENTRFTVYSKSIGATSFQIMLSAFLGSKGVTLSIFDLEGCVLSEEPEFGELLKSRKKFCDMVTEVVCDGYRETGIAMITSPDRFVDRKDYTNPTRISDLSQNRTNEHILLKAGIPCVYCVPENLKDYNAVFLDADAVLQLNDDELKSCLTKGVFMDSQAAIEIIKRGFKEYIGADIGEKIYSIAASEQLIDLKHNDGSDVYVPSRISGGKWREIIPEGAEVISKLITPDGKKRPGFVLYENSLGGRICIYASDGCFGDGFYSNYRIKLLRNICSYLSTDIPVVELKNYGMCVVKEKDDKLAIFIANLSADTMKDIHVTLKNKYSFAQIISKDGRIDEVSITDGKLTVSEELNIYDAVTIIAK